MNKADNDASTRAIDSLINYEVSWCTLYGFCSLYTRFSAIFLLIVSKFSSVFLSSDSAFFYQTVKYFNNEGFEADKYDKYLKSKFWYYHNYWFVVWWLILNLYIC